MYASSRSIGCSLLVQFRWTVVHFSAFYGHKEVLEELLLRYPHLKDKREKVRVVSVFNVTVADDQ